NKIFAKNTLDSHEFNKFSRIYDILTEDLTMPNTIIFLDAELDVLKHRIAKRNRSFEHQIEDDYLLALKRDYHTFYSSLKDSNVQVLHINTSNMDFVNNNKDYQEILTQVKTMIGDK
ncbi:deoxynucleoside kinase, partial [Staphylococcus warneri]